ncbi:class V lanthionine synthetase subunit LxmK [Kitasatospora xanthocidica]|uniref:class V lanthionine synthetase subunit LxmK n=1 Tax=Kitasatospora xanthocidica TaxID=83382 RepID=UPI0016789D63|nr:class V lanthionine synthetase subunit LxmK [Kitasatospora xanthocidica]
MDLKTVPHVDAFLGSLGLGPLDPDTVSATGGRNNNWSGTTGNGTPVFVKQLLAGDRDDRLRRTVGAAGAIREEPLTPRLIGADADHALLVFEQIPDSTSGAQLALDESFDEGLCARAGTAVAAFHGLRAPDFETSEHPLPPVGLLDALPLEHYGRASAAELAMWRLLHADAQIIEALKALRRADTPDGTTRCPVHGDLRLDQFLLAGDQLHLTDFEEARLGDPARDVGAFAGEWLFQAAAGLPAKLAASSSFGHVATHEEIIAAGAAEIERHAPLVRAFYRAYLAAAPAAITADADLPVRAAAYAGWHMIDRMLAAADSASQLSPVNKAAAGIGRTVLLSPADFTSTLGLEA